MTCKVRIYRVSQQVLDIQLQPGSGPEVGSKAKGLLFSFRFGSLPVPVNPEVNLKLALKIRFWDFPLLVGKLFVSPIFCTNRDLKSGCGSHGKIFCQLLWSSLRRSFVETGKRAHETSKKTSWGLGDRVSLSYGLDLENCTAATTSATFTMHQFKALRLY